MFIAKNKLFFSNNQKEKTMKAIYVRRGEVLKIEHLQDGVTGEDYLQVRNDQGVTVRVTELIAPGASTMFTADESKVPMWRAGLIYNLFELIVELRKTGADCIRKGQMGNEEVKYILFKNLAAIFNEKHGRIEMNGFTAETAGQDCRELGMRSIRVGKGWGVVVENDDLRAAESRFEPQKDDPEEEE
jgi:Holliday junction resolvase